MIGVCKVKVTNKMFNAFKKLASRQDGGASPAIAANASGNGANANSTSAVPMAGSLQRKFAKGVQYNSELRQ